MKLDAKMCKVLADMEYFIGSECYNPNSYDGWNDIEGCEFRYPINVPINGEDNYTKIRGKITGHWSLEGKSLTPEMVKYMKYKFGSNELYVGLGLIHIMEYLEERYGLDFNEMEKKHKN